MYSYSTTANMLGTYTAQTLLLLALLVVGRPLSAQVPVAAPTNSAVAQASANVIIALTVEGVQDLLFDEIMAGEEKIIQLDGTATGRSATGLEQSGKFRVNTTGSFMLEFSEVPTSLLGPNESSMPVSFFSAWSANNLPPPAGNNQILLDGTRSVVVRNSNGDVFVFLGARVFPPSNQQEGLYQTRIVLTATYGID